LEKLSTREITNQASWKRGDLNVVSYGFSEEGYDSQSAKLERQKGEIGRIAQKRTNLFAALHLRVRHR